MGGVEGIAVKFVVMDVESGLRPCGFYLSHDHPDFQILLFSRPEQIWEVLCTSQL